MKKLEKNLRCGSKSWTAINVLQVTITSINLLSFFVEDSCQISASEDQAEDSIEDDSSHLQKLHSYVTECEENLTKHK